MEAWHSIQSILLLRREDLFTMQREDTGGWTMQQEDTGRWTMEREDTDDSICSREHTINISIPPVQLHGLMSWIDTGTEFDDRSSSCKDAIARPVSASATPAPELHQDSCGDAVVGPVSVSATPATTLHQDCNCRDQRAMKRANGVVEASALSTAEVTNCRGGSSDECPSESASDTGIDEADTGIDEAQSTTAQLLLREAISIGRAVYKAVDLDDMANLLGAKEAAGLDLDDMASLLAASSEPAIYKDDELDGVPDEPIAEMTSKSYASQTSHPGNQMMACSVDDGVPDEPIAEMTSKSYASQTSHPGNQMVASSAASGPNSRIEWNQCWSEDMIGKHTVEIDGLRVNKEFSRFSDMVQTLARGTKIKILEISDKEEKGRVRARIQDPAGWISYRNGSNYFVKKVQEATNDFPIAEEQHPPDISSASSIATGSRTNRQRMRVSAEQELVRMVSPFAGNAVPPVDSAGNPVPPDPVPSVESHIFGHVNTVRSFNRRLLEMVRTGDKAAILDLYEREEPQILLEAYCDMVDNFFPNRKALDRFKIKFYAVCPKEDFMELVRRRGEPVMESLYLGDSSSMDEIRATMDIVATIDY